MGLKNYKELYKDQFGYWILFTREIAFNKEKELVESHVEYDIAVDIEEINCC